MSALTRHRVATPTWATADSRPRIGRQDTIRTHRPAPVPSVTGLEVPSYLADLGYNVTIDTTHPESYTPKVTVDKKYTSKD